MRDRPSASGTSGAGEIACGDGDNFDFVDFSSRFHHRRLGNA